MLLASKKPAMHSCLTALLAYIVCSVYILSAHAQNYAITSYGVTGTGCPAGTVSVDLADDSKDMSLVYKTFTATTGPGADTSDERKNCQLTLGVKVPSGYQFALDKFNHATSYSISSGVQAIISSYYYFQSSTADAKGSSTFSGPAKYDGNVAHVYTPTIWSPCGAQTVIVGINTAARVDNSANNGGSGSLTVLNTPSYSFVWRSC